MGDNNGDDIETGGKRSSWMMHVKKTMRAHKGMKLKQVLKMAKKTYKKSRRGGAALTPATYGGQEGGAGGVASTAAAVGGRRRRGSSKSRSRKH